MKVYLTIDATLYCCDKRSEIDKSSRSRGSSSSSLITSISPLDILLPSKAVPSAFGANCAHVSLPCLDDTRILVPICASTHRESLFVTSSESFITDVERLVKLDAL